MTTPPLPHDCNGSANVHLAVLWVLAEQDRREARLARYDRLVAGGWKPSEALVEVNRA